MSRRLPQTSFLETFEAAARRGSFTLAALDLNMTQGAVSRQIKALEEQLGTALFLRERQRVSLSPAGAVYLDEISQALAIIRKASTALQINPDGGVLNLGILPTFGTRWLAPKLPEFLQQNPGITVNLSTRLRPFDFDVDLLDAAIHFGSQEWPGTEHLFIAEETVVPACSPTLLPELNIRSVEDIARAPLLHIATRPEAWTRWFAMNGMETEIVAGTTFDQFATLAQAAAHGLGLALLPGTRPTGASAAMRSSGPNGEAATRPCCVFGAGWKRSLPKIATVCRSPDALCALHILWPFAYKTTIDRRFGWCKNDG